MCLNHVLCPVIKQWSTYHQRNSMLRSYEGVFIVNATLDSDVINSVIGSVRSLIRGSGEVIDEIDMGVRRFAYSIKHLDHGSYYCFEFRCEPDRVRSLDTMCRRDNRIVRFLICSLDRHGVAYNAKKRSSLVSHEEEDK